MSNARNLADLLNSSGDVKSEHLDNQTTYSDATSSVSGLMSATMKSKLDAIEAVGGGNTTDEGLYEMANTISSNYSITSGNNAMTAGPITINSGVSVTIPTGSTWVIT